jgi:predicted component of type VI protein secretion system
MARLIFSGAKFGGRTYEFALPKTTIGRGDHNTLAIHDPSVSQYHCEILVHGPEVIVRDLGSTNGTYVNGQRLCSQQCQLKPGQTVRFGLVEARLELDPPSFSDTAFAETAIFSYVRHQQERLAEGGKPAAVSMKLEPLLGTSQPGAELIPPPVDEAVRRPQDRPQG